MADPSALGIHTYTSPFPLNSITPPSHLSPIFFCVCNEGDMIDDGEGGKLGRRDEPERRVGASLKKQVKRGNKG